MKVTFVAGIESVQVFEGKDGKKGGRRVHGVGQGHRPSLVMMRVPDNGYFVGVDAEKLFAKCQQLASRRALAAVTCELGEWNGKPQYDLLAVEEVKAA